MVKKSERLGTNLNEELDAMRDHKAGKRALKSTLMEKANQEEAANEKYQERLAEWDTTLSDGMSKK